jgi:hypothetical protein
VETLAVEREIPLSSEVHLAMQALSAIDIGLPKVN